MTASRRIAALALAAALASTARAGGPAPNRYGDPLPDGALGRLGMLSGDTGSGASRCEPSFSADGKTLAIANGRVRGEEISFKAGGKDYRGRVNNGKLELK